MTERHYYRYRSAVNGQIVSKAEADAAPNETVRERVNVDDDTVVEEQPMPQDNE